MSLFDQLLDVEQGDVVPLYGIDFEITSITRSAASKRLHGHRFEIELDARTESVHVYEYDD